MALPLRVKTIAASGLALLFLRAAQAARISNINVNAAGGKPALHPIIIMGPLLGQTLMAKDTRLLSWCGSSVFSSYDEVWIGDKSNLVLCGLGAKQLHLKFDPKTNLSSPLQSGVHVKVADSWDGLSLMGKDVYASITNRLEREGYTRDVDMIAHPYDWRLGVADWRVDSFPAVKEKIEEAVHFTGKRIVMTGISMAGPFTHAFLTWVREYGGPDWPSKYVHAWVPIGAPWNGAVNALSAVLSSALTAWATPTRTFANASFSCPDCIPKIAGEALSSGFGLFNGILKELDVYLEEVVQDKLTELVRTLPSIYWMSTNLDYSTTPPTDKTYVELAHKLVLSEGAGIEPVKASEMPKLFRKGGLVEEAQLLEYGMSVGTTTDPGVPVHCVYSTNVRTFQRIRIPVPARPLRPAAPCGPTNLLAPQVVVAMLHLKKNRIVTGVARKQVEIRQLEVDWYCGNYSTITGQAAMLAGFAFTQLTTPMPDDYEPPFMLEFGYMFLTCMAIGLELSAIILSTFLSVWGPSLALRGRGGASDLHRAVDCLRDYQFLVFLYFIIGWVIFFLSSILQVWIYFKRRVAVVVTFPLSMFILAIVWYSFDITKQLRLDDRDAVAGKIDHLQPYEFIGDLDHGLHSEGWVDGRETGDAAQAGYCPVNPVAAAGDAASFHASVGTPAGMGMGMAAFRPKLAGEVTPGEGAGAGAGARTARTNGAGNGHGPAKANGNGHGHGHGGVR